MKHTQPPGLRLQEPEWHMPQKPHHRTALFHCLLDCLLGGLLAGGLTDCLLTLYRFPVTRWPLLLGLVLFTSIWQICLHRKNGRIFFLFPYVLAAVLLLLRHLREISAGGALAVNTALNTLQLASRGQFDFGSVPVPAVYTGWSESLCLQIFLLLLLSALLILLGLLLYNRMALLYTLLLLALLTPPLTMTIDPPRSVILLLVTCVVLFLLRTRRHTAEQPAPALTRRGLLTLPALLLVTALLSSVLLPPAQFVRPQPLETLRLACENALQNFSPRHAHAGLANAVNRVDMRQTASVSFSGKTMLRVTTSTREAQYLKSFTGTQYADSTWTPASGSAYDAFLQNKALQKNPYHSQNVQSMTAQFETLKWSLAGKKVPASANLTVENIAANSRCLYLPYGTDALPPNAVYVRDQNARFSNWFGRNSYTLSLHPYSHNTRSFSLFSPGTTGQWPIFSAYGLAESLLQARETAKPFAPDQQELLQNLGLAWNLTDQFAALHAGTAYLLQLLNPYNAEDKKSSYYLLQQSDVDQLRAQLRGSAEFRNPVLFDMTAEEFEQALSKVQITDLRSLYTQPLIGATSANHFLRLDPTRPLSLSTLDEQVQQYVDYAYQYQKSVYEENTQVPPALLPSLRQWLQKHGLDPNSTAALGSNGERSSVNSAVSKVLQNLDSACQYTLAPGAPPAGKDFIDYFLNENHAGYCVHFATAATLLLRTLGIPARYAEGYYLPATKLDGSSTPVNVTDDHAHAWVEVYSNGLGWIPFETTPGFSTLSTQNNLKEYQTPSSANSSPVSSAAPESKDPAEEASRPAPSRQSPSDAASNPTADSAENAPAPAPDSRIIFVAAAAAILLACFLRRRFWEHRRKAAFTQPNRRAAAAALYRYLQRLEPFGVPISPEVHALWEKAQFSKEGASPEDLEQLRQVAARSCRQALKKQNAWKRFLFRWGSVLHYPK